MSRALCVGRWFAGGSYVIEGVDFLPVQIAQLAARFQISSVFLGRSKMTLALFDKYPGHSPGYAGLPEEVRRQFAQDVPLWSEFVRQEAQRFDYPYVDMSEDFHSRLNEAAAVLRAGTGPKGGD